MLSEADRTLLLSEIARGGLEDYTDSILSAARTAIRLTPSGPIVDDDGSRLGGSTWLPLGVAWPTWKERPLALIAQINLSEVAPFDLEGVLPTAGRLLFLYDAEQETWGFDPADRDSWRVIHVPDSAERGPDVPDGNVFPSTRLRPVSEISLPPWESLWFDSTGMSETELDSYLEMRERLLLDNELSTKLLGHPDPVQGDMQTECQLASNGVYCGTAEGYNSERGKSLATHASDWRLLLQVDSEDDAEMMWGDVGRLYFWIRNQDLERRMFHASWFILQCG